eukprot:scpid57652/ scgid23780/ 
MSDMGREYRLYVAVFGQCHISPRAVCGVLGHCYMAPLSIDSNQCYMAPLSIDSNQCYMAPLSIDSNQCYMAPLSIDSNSLHTCTTAPMLFSLSDEQPMGTMLSMQY